MSFESRLQALENKVAASKPIPELPLLTSSDGTQYLAVYNPATQQLEKVSLKVPQTKTPPASGTFSIDLSNYLGTDYSGSTTSLTGLNVSSGAVQGGFARVKGNWSTQPIFTGATEAESSIFTSNTDIYLYVEQWADGVVYWYDND